MGMAIGGGGSAKEWIEAGRRYLNAVGCSEVGLSAICTAPAREQNVAIHGRPVDVVEHAARAIRAECFDRLGWTANKWTALGRGYIYCRDTERLDHGPVAVGLARSSQRKDAPEGIDMQRTNCSSVVADDENAQT
jgi:hypothetical protein